MVTEDIWDAFGGTYRDRTVLVTGHTGFKGSWLTVWLASLGARVVGYSLAPPTRPSLFERAHVRSECAEHIEADVRDFEMLADVARRVEPDCVFHLAAQPIVRQSYRTPVETFDVNVVGTASLLDAVRRTGVAIPTVVVTSDKSYAPSLWDYAHHEDDELGGADPYSASKAAAELVVRSLRASFGRGAGDPLSLVATARAGNVIGGGDWAPDRLVPDCIRFLERREPVPVRSPDAIRPWQHVLEPLSGYLQLGSHLLRGSAAAQGEWNFGPCPSAEATVADIVECAVQGWGDGSWVAVPNDGPVETQVLRVSIDKAQVALGWRPVWTVAEAVRHTVAWYAGTASIPSGREVSRFCTDDLRAYSLAARAAGLAWAAG